MQAVDWKNKGNEAVSAGNFMEAIKCYTSAIELDSNDHVYFSNRSAAYLQLNEAEKALEDATQCIKLKPTWGKGYARKGAALHHQKRYDEAIEAYEEGLKYDANNNACMEGIEEIKKIQNGAGGNPLAGLFGPDMYGKIATNPKLSPFLADPEFIKKLQDIQNNPSSINQHLSDQRIMMVLTEFMGLNLNDVPPPPQSAGMPESTTYSPKRANSPKKAESPNLSSPKKAKTTYEPEEPIETEEEKAIRQKKLEAEKSKVEGNGFYKKREFEKALECYKAANELDPTNMAYLTNAAAVYFEMNEFEQCIEKCNESIKLGREQRADYALIAKAYVRIGNAYLKQSQEKNVEFIEKACKAYEDALVESRTKDIELKLKGAQRILRVAQELAYRNPELALEAKNEGNDFFKSGNFPKAVELYTEAIKRDPENPVYYANRAAALTKLTSFVDAKSDCEKAIALDPNYTKAYSRKGAIEFFMKEYHKAMESYKKGLEIDPENQECKDGLQRVMYAIQNNNNEEINKERAEHALADPEIQQILRDPVIQSVLQDMQQNPQSAMKHMSNPDIMQKIEKLIASGVLQTK